MSDVVSTFPLLCLPIDAILHTFRTMDYLQIFGISLLSKKSKNFVNSSKLTIMYLQVQVKDSFEIDLFINFNSLRFKLYQVLENEPHQELETPENLNISYRNTNVTWTNSMSTKQLLDHLKLIFHSPVTTLFFEENCERFSLESVHKNVTDIRTICLLSGNHEHNRKILGLFQPASLTLVVPSVRTTLNELLTTNSRVIDLVCNGFSANIINRFLKLWVKGSNPRLEWMFLRFRTDIRTEELLKGLKCKVAPLDRMRLFNNTAEKNMEKVYGGWDISRCDGTKATITVDEGLPVIFELYVWHDHCIVD